MSVTVDGVDLATLGFVVDSESRGWRDGVHRIEGLQQLPNRIRSARVVTTPQSEPRRLTITGTQKAASLAALETALDELKARLASGLLEIGFGGTSRVYRARLDGQVSVSPIPPAFMQPAHRLEIPLVCPDPRALKASDTVVGGIGAAPVAIPQGTAPSRPVVRVTGATSFVLTLKTGGGQVISTFEVSGATAPTWIEVDSERLTVENDAGASQIDAVVTGSVFPVPYVSAADYVAATWPTLECSAGTAQATYREAWW